MSYHATIAATRKKTFKRFLSCVKHHMSFQTYFHFVLKIIYIQQHMLPAARSSALTKRSLLGMHQSVSYYPRINLGIGLRPPGRGGGVRGSPRAPPISWERSGTLLPNVTSDRHCRQLGPRRALLLPGDEPQHISQLVQ